MPRARRRKKRPTEEPFTELLTRIAMYLCFIGVLTIPIWLLLNQLPYANDSLVFTGAAELAYAFYAFTAGNSSYSMVPAYRNKEVKRDMSERAARIIQAGRLISISAILLMSSGMIVLDHFPQVVLPLLLLVYGLISSCSYRLSENMEVVPDEYAISLNRNYYNTWKKRKEARKTSVMILFLSGLFLLAIFFLRRSLLQFDDVLVLIMGMLLSALGIVDWARKYLDVLNKGKGRTKRKRKG